LESGPSARKKIARGTIGKEKPKEKESNRSERIVATMKGSALSRKGEGRSKRKSEKKGAFTREGTQAGQTETEGSGL